MSAKSEAILAGLRQIGIELGELIAVNATDDELREGVAMEIMDIINALPPEARRPEFLAVLDGALLPLGFESADVSPR